MNKILILILFIKSSVLFGNNNLVDSLNVNFEFQHENGTHLKIKNSTKDYILNHTKGLYLKMSIISNKLDDGIVDTELGIAYHQTDLANDTIFGNAKSVFPYISFHMLGNDKINLRFINGLGFSYINRQFDMNKNFENSAIGSHLNAIIHLSLQLDIRLNKFFNLYTSINFNHFSNASLNKPNNGINILSRGIGIKYKRSKNILNRTKPKKYKLLNNRSILVWRNAIVNASLANNSKYYITDLAYMYMISLGRISRLGPGVEFNYDSSVLKKIDNYVANTSLKYRFRSLIFVRKSFQVARMILFADLGIYCYDKLSYYNRSMYRLGFGFNLSPKLISTCSIKVHKNKSDYLAYGIAYSF
ncbi:MAG: acyloxyacyl hydrolase [Marinifilaceae bacterium]|jgi:hypothetical protein|nr:acyloxyacyl hydrolase [Marinifilaceae bacterium]